MNKEKFFERLEIWSERKHRILGKYIAPFVAKVASITKEREIFCVDGFAGAAKYKDGKAGSPLIIAQLSDKCAAWQDPASLRIINVEADKEMFASLEHITQRWVEKGTVVNVKDEFHNAVPFILQEIGQTPSLLFIDPFGPTDFSFSDLFPILRRDQPITELILNFDTDGLRRIADATGSQSSDPSVQKGIQTNIENVTKILGSNKWLEPYNHRQLTTEQKEDFLLSLYIENLSQFGYFVVAYGICEALGKAPKYHLIYCTRHQDGVSLMNDFIFEEDNSMLGDHYSENMPLFPDSINDETEKRRKRLTSLVEDFLRQNRNSTRGFIKREIIFKYFAQFHRTDYNAVMKELLESERLRASHGKKRINDNEPLTYLGE